MCVQNLDSICNLRANFINMVPDNATEDNIWEFLGWDEDCSKSYLIAKQYGIDLRPIIAPIFSDVVSLITNTYIDSKPHSWEDILQGNDLTFQGDTPKKRVLSVINKCARNFMNA